MAARVAAPGRRLPAAFAIGVRREIHLSIELEGTRRLAAASCSTTPTRAWRPTGCRCGSSCRRRSASTSSYAVVPTRRGPVTFAPAELRVRVALAAVSSCSSGSARSETRRVYPDFAQVARYAWLAGDRRLQEIGIKSYQQRGQGTDFKQLADYRIGDSVRHIDWKATLRLNRPIVREFQDERDQCVLFLLDCGRRMRADDGVSASAPATSIRCSTR